MIGRKVSEIAEIQERLTVCSLLKLSLNREGGGLTFGLDMAEAAKRNKDWTKKRQKS